MAKNRNDQRKLVGLLVKLAHKGLDEFATNRHKRRRAISEDLRWEQEVDDHKLVVKLRTDIHP